jgi:Helix-turn-helix domain
MIPNFTQIPNYFIDSEMSSLSDTAFRVLLIIARHTYGWIENPNNHRRKDKDWISYSQLMKISGRTTPPIIKAVKELEEKKLIEVLGVDGNFLPTEERQGKRIFYRIATYKESLYVSEPTYKETLYTKENIISNDISKQSLPLEQEPPKGIIPGVTPVDKSKIKTAAQLVKDARNISMIQKYNKRYEKFKPNLFFTRNKQFVALNEMLDNKYTPITEDEIFNCADWLFSQAFWVDKGISFITVKSQLSNYRINKNKSNVIESTRKQMTADEREAMYKKDHENLPNALDVFNKTQAEIRAAKEKEKKIREENQKLYQNER